MKDKNRENERRRRRYAEDPEYRERILEKNRINKLNRELKAYSSMRPKILEGERLYGEILTSRRLQRLTREQLEKREELRLGIRKLIEESYGALQENEGAGDLKGYVSGSQEDKVRCEICGRLDNGYKGRGGLCLDCFCVEFMIFLNERKKINESTRVKRAVKEIDLNREFSRSGSRMLVSA